MKNMNQFNLGRRNFITGAAFSAAALSVPGVLAEELTKTPIQGEGPFYPNKMPLDTDNDLLVINDQIDLGVGEITHLSGRILSPAGEPVRNATIEIWEADNNGVYIHTGDPDREKQDSNFQGFGRFLTNSKGEYYFRTIKPKPYRGRTAHIHVAVLQKGKRVMTTECYVKGEKKNQTDRILNSIKDPKQRERLIVDFKPIKDSKIGELAANFDIVIESRA